MKKIIYTIIVALISINLSAQYFTMDFFVLNEGTESDYLKLEQVWKEYQMDAVEKGEKLGWMVFKVNKRNGEPLENTSYVVVNDYKSKEQFENQGKNWSWANFNSIVRSRLKGKMSSSTIRRVLAKNVKKETYSMQGFNVDATPWVGGNIKKGDIFSWGTAKALNEDYIMFEKEVWKPIAMRSVMSGDQYYWGITEITQKNDLLQKNQTVDFTHMYVNFFPEEPAPVNESAMMNQMDFKTQKLMELLNKSCERGPGFTASLVMSTW